MGFLECLLVFGTQMLAAKGAKNLLEQKVDIGRRPRRGHTGLQPSDEVERCQKIIVVVAPVRWNRLHHREGNPDVGSMPDGRSKELGRCDADDAECGRAHLQRSVQDIRIAQKSALPPRIADNGYRVVALGPVVGVRERTAYQRMHAQGLEIGAGDQLHLHRLRLIAPFDEAMNVVADAEDRGRIRENLILLLQLAIEGIGIKFGEAEVIGDAAHIARAQQHKLLRLLDGQRAQHHGVHQAEDGGVGADAERERQQRHEGDARAAEHRAQSIEHILQKPFEPAPPPGRVTALTQECRIPKAPIGGRFCAVRRDTRLYLLLPSQIQMKLHLVFEVLCQPLAVEQHTDAPYEFSEPVHRPAPPKWFA